MDKTYSERNKVDAIITELMEQHNANWRGNTF